MKCPKCQYDNDKVVDSRIIKDGKEIRRRRLCNKCGFRFTTYERYEPAHLSIIKNDKRREEYSRQKIRSSLEIACRKRQISIDKINEVTDRIEENLFSIGKEEIKSSVIGELVMKELFELDDVAYVRFASVYKKFKDTGEFLTELQNFLSKHTT